MKKIIIFALFLSLFAMVSCKHEENKEVTKNEENENKIESNEKMMNKEWTEEKMPKVGWEKKGDDDMMEWERSEEETAEMNRKYEGDDDMMNNSELKWGYRDYNWESLVGLEGNNVLFFHATWCPSCKSADDMLKSSTIPWSLSIIKVDYDSNQELKEKYNVLSQHTFVQIDKDWNEVTSWSGWRSIEDIISKLK